MSGLTDADRDRIRYAAGHLVSGESEQANPDPHAAESVELAWDVFDEIIAAREKALAEKIAQAIEALTSVARDTNPTAHAHLIGYAVARKAAARIAREQVLQ